MAALSTDGDQGNSEPLKYKTWFLRVSIHCEGCKRKVKRILHSVEGVYTIDVDARQHKVVVTGNVEANTLLRKLEKSGKHAELWHRNQSNEQPQQQQEITPPIQIQNQNQNPENQKFDEPQKTNNESQIGSENSGQPQQQQQQPPQQVKEVRFEGNVAGEPPNPPANNPAGGGNGGGEGGGGASKKKKKKKKGNSGNNTTTGNNPNNNGGNSNNNNNNGGEVGGVGIEQGPNGGPPSTESQPNPTHHPNPVSMSPPRQPPNCRVYEYPSPSYGPSPVYTVSHNMAYPSSSISASYYSAPMPYSYAHVHQGGDVDVSAPLDWNPHAVPPPSDSFEIFSDENPNACAVM